MKSILRKEIAIAVVVMVFGMTSSAFAAIISTEVSTAMEIWYGASVVDAAASQIDATNASVSIAGNVTSATAYSTWQLSNITSDSAELFADFGFDGSGVCDPTLDPECGRITHTRRCQVLTLDIICCTVLRSFRFSANS